MSSDPTRPLPPPEWNPDAPTQQYPAGGQRPPRPTFTPNERYQPQQQYERPRPAYEYDQQYDRQHDQRYGQQHAAAPAGRAAAPAGRAAERAGRRAAERAGRRAAERAGRRRRRRWPVITGIVVIVLLLLAVGADRFARYEAENQMADKIQQNGLPVKPNVSIDGFPFLTQLAAKDFNEVVISASNVTEGSLTIASINATLHGMHLIDGYSGARIDTLNGSALITFAALAHAGGIPSGITLGPGASPSEIKASVSVFGLGTSVTAQVSKTSSNRFDVRVLNAGGVPADVLGNLANFTINVPRLPAGMNIASVTVNQQGVLITITGQNTTLTQS